MEPPQTDPLELITPKTVKAALESLLYTSTSQNTHVLEHLKLVDQLLNPVPGGRVHRRYALKELLTSLITRQYLAHRQAVNLHLPGEPLTSELAENFIRADSRSGHHELISWSWLYYHFIRVELPVSAQSFSQWCTVDQRTLRRHYRHALQRLTEVLIEAEQEARQKIWKNHLYARLPLPFPVTLVGHHTARMQIQYIFGSEQPHHLLITGEKGIGKTAVIQEAIRQQIETGQIEHLIWITAPASINEIQHQLAHWSGIFDNPILLRQYTLTRHLTLVLDGIDRLIDALEALEKLLVDLGAVRIYLTAGQSIPLSTVRQIALKPLNQDETRTLSSRLARLHSMENELCSDDVLVLVWRQSRGNPCRIKAIILSLISEQISNPV